MHEIRELSNSYEMSKLAIDSMVDCAVYILDKNGIILSSNSGAKNLTAFDSREISNTHFARFYTMDDIENKIPEYQISQAESLGRFEGEGLHVRKDGTQFWADIVIHRLNDQNGHHIGFSKVIRDLTSKKNHEDALKESENYALKTSKLKSQFIADISHEIRTPLGAILGFAEFLQRSELSHEESLHYLDIIVKNGKSLNRVINDVLDLSKIEAGRIDVEMQDFNLNQMIDEVLDLFHMQCYEKNISLNFSHDEKLNSITTDPIRLRQVLTNLISNAVKFTESGEISISAEKIDESEEINNYRILIKDSGVGLNQEEVTKIFHPFVQVRRSQSKACTGTGLGLVLSRKIAEALGGDVELISTKSDVGSIFAIRFADYKNFKRMNRPAKIETTPHSLESKSILIVDDSEDNLEIIQLFLSSYGGTTDIATSGNEAISKIQSKQYDVILMDIEMPKMSGFQVIEELKNLNITVPVIALTAHAMPEDKLKTKNAGFFDHVTKPIDFDYLVSKIENLKPLH